MRTLAFPKWATRHGEVTSSSRAAGHYDLVTDTWMKHIMGEELHFGLFATGRETLAEATHNLTLCLADRAQLQPGLEVLDVGCGTGAPALHLALHQGCRVLGISTSAAGIEVANARAKDKNCEDRARFELRDATDNGLPDASFDRVFALESAHLMQDKTRLFSECRRVLRPGGKLALCDCVLIGSEDDELMQYVLLGHSPRAAGRMRAAVHETMHRAFGSSVLAHRSVYENAARAAGFVDVEVEDLTAPARKTLARWADHAAADREAIVEKLGQRYYDDFFLALLHMSFTWGRIGGYIVLTATK